MLGISMYWQVRNKIDTINNYQISISVNTNQKIEVNNTTKKQIQWKDKDKKEVCVDKNHKSQKHKILDNGKQTVNNQACKQTMHLVPDATNTKYYHPL